MEKHEAKVATSKRFQKTFMNMQPFIYTTPELSLSFSGQYPEL